jgi:hypothetical protein
MRRCFALTFVFALILIGAGISGPAPAATVTIDAGYDLLTMGSGSYLSLGPMQIPAVGVPIGSYDFPPTANLGSTFHIQQRPADITVTSGATTDTGPLPDTVALFRSAVAVSYALFGGTGSGYMYGISSPDATHLTTTDLTLTLNANGLGGTIGGVCTAWFNFLDQNGNVLAQDVNINFDASGTWSISPPAGVVPLSIPGVTTSNFFIDQITYTGNGPSDQPEGVVTHFTTAVPEPGSIVSLFCGKLSVFGYSLRQRTRRATLLRKTGFCSRTLPS